MKDRFCFRAAGANFSLTGTSTQDVPHVPTKWSDEKGRKALAVRLFSEPDGDGDLFPHEKEIKNRYVEIMTKSSDPLSPDEKHEMNILSQISNKYIEIRKLLRELNKQPEGKEGNGDPEHDGLSFLSDGPRPTYPPLPDRQPEVDGSLPFRPAADGLYKLF